MAAKSLLSLLQTAATAGGAQVTSNVLTASGTSREFGELASADAARIYLDISAVSGTGSPKIVFTLYERDPATGVFFANNPAGDPIFNATGFTGTQAGLITTIDPAYAESCQIGWTVTGTTPSFTCSLVALLMRRVTTGGPGG